MLTLLVLAACALSAQPFLYDGRTADSTPEQSNSITVTVVTSVDFDKLGISVQGISALFDDLGLDPELVKIKSVSGSTIVADADNSYEEAARSFVDKTPFDVDVLENAVTIKEIKVEGGAPSAAGETKGTGSAVSAPRETGKGTITVTVVTSVNFDELGIEVKGIASLVDDLGINPDLVKIKSVSGNTIVADADSAYEEVALAFVDQTPFDIDILNNTVTITKVTVKGGSTSTASGTKGTGEPVSTAGESKGKGEPVSVASETKGKGKQASSSGESSGKSGSDSASGESKGKGKEASSSGESSGKSGGSDSSSGESKGKGKAAGEVKPEKVVVEQQRDSMTVTVVTSINFEELGLAKKDISNLIDDLGLDPTLVNIISVSGNKIVAEADSSYQEAVMAFTGSTPFDINVLNNTVTITKIEISGGAIATGGETKGTGRAVEQRKIGGGGVGGGGSQRISYTCSPASQWCVPCPQSDCNRYGDAIFATVQECVSATDCASGFLDPYANKSGINKAPQPFEEESKAAANEEGKGKKNGKGKGKRSRKTRKN